jgi:phosphoserine aminotransferase
MSVEKPSQKPVNPRFSSGPCAKRPGWSPSVLKEDVLGRSHRGKLGKGRLVKAIEDTRQLLQVPADYLIGIMAGSDTGAFEAAMWSLLGPRPVDVLVWESFSKGWATDIAKQLKLEARVMTAGYGEIPDLSKVDPSHDIVFAWNGTTSGAMVPNADWIAANREGLTLCDATSAAFAMDLPWDKLDVTTFSWQKCLGGEAAHGVLILSPRAVARIESYDPAWPMPKIFRMKKGDKIDKSIFEGSTINTPSMACVDDYLDALAWGRELGGLSALIAKSKANLAAIEKWVAANPAFGFLAADKAVRSHTSVCIKIVDAKFASLSDEEKTATVKKIGQMLDAEAAAYDIVGYRDAPAGFRFWCGPTVNAKDIEIGLEWLAWAYAQA